MTTEHQENCFKFAEPFNEEAYQWTTYVRRLKNKFSLYNISDDKQVLVLTDVISPKHYEWLCNVCHPEEPETKSFNELCSILDDYFHPKSKNKFVARCAFYKRIQAESETVRNFAADLAKLSHLCQFPKDWLNEALVTQFIVGVKLEELRQKLIYTDFTNLRDIVTFAAEHELIKKRTLGRPKSKIRSLVGEVQSVVIETDNHDEGFRYTLTENQKVPDRFIPKVKVSRYNIENINNTINEESSVKANTVLISASKSSVETNVCEIENKQDRKCSENEVTSDDSEKQVPKQRSPSPIPTVKRLKLTNDDSEVVDDKPVLVIAQAKRSRHEKRNATKDKNEDVYENDKAEKSKPRKTKDHRRTHHISKRDIPKRGVAAAIKQYKNSDESDVENDSRIENEEHGMEKRRKLEKASIHESRNNDENHNEGEKKSIHSPSRKEPSKTNEKKSSHEKEHSEKRKSGRPARKRNSKEIVYNVGEKNSTSEKTEVKENTSENANQGDESEKLNEEKCREQEPEKVKEHVKRNICKRKRKISKRGSHRKTPVEDIRDDKKKNTIADKEDAKLEENSSKEQEKSDNEKNIPEHKDRREQNQNGVHDENASNEEKNTLENGDTNCKNEAESKKKETKLRNSVNEEEIKKGRGNTSCNGEVPSTKETTSKHSREKERTVNDGDGNETDSLSTATKKSDEGKTSIARNWFRRRFT